MLFHKWKESHVICPKADEGKKERVRVVSDLIIGTNPPQRFQFSLEMSFQVNQFSTFDGKKLQSTLDNFGIVILSCKLQNNLASKYSL